MFPPVPVTTGPAKVIVTVSPAEIPAGGVIVVTVPVPTTVFRSQLTEMVEAAVMVPPLQ
jgi:hypothetical protein